MKLEIAPEVTALGLEATYLVMDGLVNQEACSAFEAERQSVYKQLSASLTVDAMTSDPIVGGFREIRKKIGRSPRKYPCSIEALAGYFCKHGCLPSINLIVDIYNLVSLESRLTLGGHDLEHVVGNINCRIAQGNEPFVPLGSTQPAKVGVGDFCYFDESGDVLCRLDYRQADKSKIGLASQHCLFIIQGHTQMPEGHLEGAKERLHTLLSTYCQT